jgi:hypothetical protein
MTKTEQMEAREQLDHATGIIATHVRAAVGATDGGRVGMFNTFVGRNGARLEIVLDAAEAEAFAAWLETRIPTEP